MSGYTYARDNGDLIDANRCLQLDESTQKNAFALAYLINHPTNNFQPNSLAVDIPYKFDHETIQFCPTWNCNQEFVS